MREIKFRGKVVENDPMTNPADGWVLGFYYQDLEGGEIKHYIKNGPIAWEVLPETVGQFTGMKDKDGKEIYEGDIISSGFQTRNGWKITNWAVEWSTNRAAWICRENNPYPAPLQDVLCDVVHVLGNRHDNPEMLK